MLTKTSIMLGCGETAEELTQTMKDLRAVHFSYGFVLTGPSEYTTTSRSQSHQSHAPALQRRPRPRVQAAP